MVRTQSRPYGIFHDPYTKAHIKGFGSSNLHVYPCFLSCFMLVLASLVLGFAMLDALHRLDLGWLHLMPMRPSLGVTTWDASPDAGLLHAYPSLFHFVQWYACHACLCHLLAFYASLHACLHVHAWVFLAIVSSILQHNEDMDTRSKPTFVPHGHHHLLALLLAYLLTCLLFLFACFLVCLLIFACHVSHHMLCLPYLSCLFTLYPLHIIYASFSFHCLFAGFLFLPLHVHTWSKDV